MPAVDSAFVLLPRFTTLVGATTFTTLPMDVSAYGGVQFRIWRGPFRVKEQPSLAKLTVYLEESLDTEDWVFGPSAPLGYDINYGEPKFFSYSFRLRWFRLRIVTQGIEPIVTCWAEGLLRGGGSGVWPGPSGMSVLGAVQGARHSVPVDYRDLIAEANKDYNFIMGRIGHSGVLGPADPFGGIVITKG